MIFAVVNESKNASTQDLDRWAAACAVQEEQHAAPAESRIPIKIQAYDSRADTPADAAIFVLGDYMDVSGAEAYHTLKDDRIVALIDVAMCIQDGVSPSIDLSHEIREASKDPFCNASIGDNRGNMYDLEVCDGVQDTSYTINVDGEDVPVSDFVLPAWCDPENTKGPFDYCGKLTAPLTKTDGGYLDYVDASGHQQQLGMRPPRRARSLRSAMRAARKRSHLEERHALLSREYPPVTLESTEGEPAIELLPPPGSFDQLNKFVEQIDADIAEVIVGKELASTSATRGKGTAENPYGTWMGHGCDLCGFGSVEDVDKFDPYKPCPACGVVTLAKPAEPAQLPNEGEKAPMAGQPEGKLDAPK